MGFDRTGVKIHSHVTPILTIPLCVRAVFVNVFGHEQLRIILTMYGILILIIKTLDFFDLAPS